MFPKDAPPTNTYFIRTFGCQMNAHDSEHIAGVLRSAGFEESPTIDDAGVVVFNTCCVRQSAEDRVWGNVGAISTGRRASRVVAVCGCMAEKHGLDIMRRARSVNLVFGMEALARLPGLVEAARLSPVCDLGEVGRASIDCLPSVRASASQAWVPVSHGCDNNCSYCVVPSVRGTERSRPLEDIIEEVERLADEGTVEVVLLGQNVNSYGRDSRTGPFARLLEEVAGVDGIKRVKFETSHPRDLTPDVLEVIGSVPEVCEYLHLPVQSGSDSVLAAMNRGYSGDFYLELVRRARREVPGITVTTDIIVGFPGETDDDFSATLDLVKAAECDAAYLFLYSAREGTPAATMSGEVPDMIKHQRFERLAATQDGFTARSLEKVVGSDVEVLIEGPARRGDMLSGRTRGHQVVLMQRTGVAGPIASVHIDAAGKHSLRGSILNGEE
jgi:tRNA-2-methylthio-N6-dimethylallyladenosine synthase